MTSTQLELETIHAIDEPCNNDVQLTSMQFLESQLCDQPVIAEATSSADDLSMLDKSTPEPTSPDEFSADDYTGDIASQVELSTDGLPTKWYHQQEHDYLKNVMEPESSGMEEIDDSSFVNEMSDELGNVNQENGLDSMEDDEHPKVLEVESVVNNFSHGSRTINNLSRVIDSNSRINNYDTELPQEIFHKPEEIAKSFQASSSNVMINNFVRHQESTPVVVRHQIIDHTAARFNTAVVHEQQSEPAAAFHHESFMVEESEVEDPRHYRGKC